MKKSKTGFTLIELLVVIAIIALLLSVIVPSIRKAKEVAKRMICGTNLHQVQIACIAYANEHNDMFPSRGKDFSGYPHSMLSKSGKSVMDENFFKPYLSDMREKVLFCPGALLRYRNAEMSDTGYNFNYITYQYFNYPEKSQQWLGRQPNFSRYSRAPQHLPLWACLTVVQEGETDPITNEPLAYLSHNMVEQAHRPDGINGVTAAGDTQWTKWDDCSPCLGIKPASSRSQTYYWPALSLTQGTQP